MINEIEWDMKTPDEKFVDARYLPSLTDWLINEEYDKVDEK